MIIPIIEDRRIDKSKIFVKLLNITMERDIIIDGFILYENRSECISSVESGAIMAGFISDISFNENDQYEFIFLIDCSKSVNDNNTSSFISFFKKASYYIIYFDSTFHSLFDRTITDEYSKINSKKAKKFIENMRADLSRNELIEPLKWFI